MSIVKDTIYLDHQATTPADPRVLEAMAPWLGRPANPHASHASGRQAAAAVEIAREKVAALVGAEPEQVTFTSGATEAANIAIRSLPAGSRVLASAVEHACVRETLAALAATLDVAWAPVGADGLVDEDAFADMVKGRDAAIVMAVNNEVGTVQPIATFGDVCRVAGAALMTDVTQAAGRIPVQLGAWDARAGWLSSHKLYGPQGIGALVWRGAPAATPLATGGGQERGLRPGTTPTALAVGFGAACALAAAEMERDAAHALAMSARMMAGIVARRPDVVVNGTLDSRVPHNLNLAFPGIDGDALVASVPELAISTGSACSAGALGVSHVLEAVVGPALAGCSVRIGFGRGTTPAEVDAAAAILADAVDRLAPTGQSGRQGGT